MAANCFFQHPVESYKLQIQQEADFLVLSARRLQEARAQYTHALESLETLSRDWIETGEFLVPLSSNMYVFGTLKLDCVMVNIGAGIHVEKNVEEAKTFLKRQIKLVSKQVEKVKSLVGQESSIIQGVKVSVLTSPVDR